MSLDAIGIACKDLKKTISFYSLLGMNFKEFGEGHAEATSPNGTRIMLDSFDLMKKVNSKWREPQQSGVTLCFVQESPKNVDQLYLRLVKDGFESVKEPWDAFWGQRYSSIKDPDGNQVDLFAPLK